MRQLGSFPSENQLLSLWAMDVHKQSFSSQWFFTYALSSAQYKADLDNWSERNPESKAMLLGSINSFVLFLVFRVIGKALLLQLIQFDFH